MPSRTGTAHVVTTRRTYKDKVYCTHLLRRSYREDGKVKNETLGNLSHLPNALIDIIRRSLQGETFVPASQAFEVVRSRAHGHVQAVCAAMQRLGLASVIASTPSRERDLVLAMMASRIVQPDTKLATSRRWHCSTLAEDFGLTDATEDDLYAAMDWLLARQDAIEQKLSARHLREGALVLYCSLISAASRPLALAVSMARSFSWRASEWQYSSTSPLPSPLSPCTRCSLMVTSPADCTSVARAGLN